MPEIRKDPVFGRWIIVAAERKDRPNEFRALAVGNTEYRCPFCAGNESMTPHETYSVPDGKGGWKLRVVPNKYPALCGDEPLQTVRDGIYERSNGPGMHEVVIETPDHNARTEDMLSEDIACTLRICAARSAEMQKNPLIKYVMIFKNHGKNAGASLFHPHWQIVGMPMVPLRVKQESEGTEKYFAEKASCVFCDMARAESAAGERVVAENSEFITIAPYASRFSFELWILPKKHLHSFERITNSEADALAGILKSSVSKLARSISGLCYNILIHSAPNGGPDGHYHWHIEIMPKLTQVAGFEWGTGFYINTVPPEKAAEILNRGEKYKI